MIRLFEYLDQNGWTIFYILFGVATLVTCIGVAIEVKREGRFRWGMILDQFFD